jgi:hypothetical protein
MTDDEILLLAEQSVNKMCVIAVTNDDLVAFARAIAAKEREACARLCDRLYREEKAHAASYGSGYWYVSAKDCAKKIRSRGE